MNYVFNVILFLNSQLRETLKNTIKILLNFNYWGKYVRPVLDSLFPDISNEGWVSPLKMCFNHMQLLKLNAAVIKRVYDLGYAGCLSA